MNYCYLCGKECSVQGADYGRRVIVTCAQCEYYEIERAAISKIEDPGFGPDRKSKIKATIVSINGQGLEPEIVLEGEIIRARAKAT